MRIIVTGATGFLGKHVLPVLRKTYGEDIVGLSRRDYDLTDPIAVRRMFQEQKPEVMVHLAAYVGGIAANSRYPADFFHRNILLTALGFEGAREAGIRKLIYPMGGCSYPASAASPIRETQMWDGYPQTESAAYSIAKKTGLVASQAYRRQYGLNSVVLIPGNMYGEYDNFDLEQSHVIPAMIRRFFEATLSGAAEVRVWGSGTPVRDFVYAGDVAETIPFFIDHYDSSEPMNLSSGTTTSIRELATTIAQLVGFKGDIVFDAGKPDGQKIKIFDVERMKQLGLSAPTSLDEGLKKTIAWFTRNYAGRSDGLRLSGVA
jgi:GDP-L-fucose synthase